MANKPTLAYWNIRGLVAPIKLLLEYAKVDYVDKQYKCGPPPTFDRGEWSKDKFSLGLDFPNLPYYIDGDVKISQSSVILRHLARKHNLVPKNEQDLLRVELFEEELKDVKKNFGPTFYNPEFEKLIGKVLAEAPAKLASLAKFIGERQYIAGDYITYIDFLFFEFLEVLLALDKKLVQDEPVLVQYHARILQLPAIQEYYNSDRFISYPFNGAPAYWGGQYSDILNKK